MLSILKENRENTEGKKIINWFYKIFEHEYNQLSKTSGGGDQFCPAKKAAKKA